MRTKRFQATPEPSKSLKTSAVIYIRVSSKEQQQEGFSLDAQLKLLKDYAQKRNLDVLDTYLDVESAKCPGRSEFGRLVSFLQAQAKLPQDKCLCRTVLVEKTDRFYRNLQDLTTIRNLGVTIHLAKESQVISPDSKSHETFSHGLNVLIAERFSNNLSEEVKKGMLEKAQQGLWPSSAPVGYLNVEGPNRKKIIQPDPVRAPLIKLMFEFYAKGNNSLKDAGEEASRIGLAHRKSGNKLNKSALYDVLTNPIYYGDFHWMGITYNGTHEPIITKELFDKVQRTMDRRSSCPTGRQSRDFQFQGVMTCSYCGCAMVAEIKKEKYVYYHCTGNKGKCPGKYAREELIDQQFAQSLGQISIDNDVIKWIVSVMQRSTAEDRRQQEEQLKSLSQQKQRLEDRLDTMYGDKLDNVITEDDYKRRSNKFRGELSDIKFKMEQLGQGKGENIDSAVRLLELSQKAASLYLKQIPSEKRELLNLVYSNSTFGSGELRPNFRKPFDLLAVTNMEYQRQKATSHGKSDLFEKWYARQDSNLRPTA